MEPGTYLVCTENRGDFDLVDKNGIAVLIRQSDQCPYVLGAWRKLEQEESIYSTVGRHRIYPAQQRVR